MSYSNALISSICSVKIIGSCISATHSRPLSEAMLSNHYYDKSEVLSPLLFQREKMDLPFRTMQHSGSRPNSVGIYSNDDEEEHETEYREEEEDSSLYEAVDRRVKKVGEFGTLPPPPPPPPLPQPQQLTSPEIIKNGSEVVSLENFIWR